MGGIEGLEGVLLGKCFQQGQQGWDGVPEGFVKRQHMAGHFNTDRARLIAVGDLEVGLEEVIADRTDDDLPSIEPDADLYIEPLAPSQLLRISSNRVLHPHRRITGPRRMVLMRQRRAKERHNPIAQDLVEGPLVAVDGLDQEVQHRIEEPPRLLWVAIGQQLHRPLQVGKQHGDLLALPFEGFAGIQDFLDEMGGGI